MLTFLANSALMMSPVGTVLKWLFGWLSHATFLQVLGVVLGIALLVDHAALLISHRENRKLAGQVMKLSEQLKAISTKRDEQKAETKSRIIQITRTIHDADARAKVVEQAPPPGNCKTAALILGADEL